MHKTVYTNHIFSSQCNQVELICLRCVSCVCASLCVCVSTSERCTAIYCNAYYGGEHESMNWTVRQTRQRRIERCTRIQLPQESTTKRAWKCTLPGYLTQLLLLDMRSSTPFRNIQLWWGNPDPFSTCTAWSFFTVYRNCLRNAQRL